MSAAVAARAPVRRKPVLSRRMRSTVLVMHIVSAVGWMGVDVALFSLLVAANTTDDPMVVMSSYVAIAAGLPISVGIMSVLMVGSGIILGMGTKWGLIQYWWVASKLAIGLLMVVLVFVALIPGLTELGDAVSPAATADAVRAQLGPAATQMWYPPIVSFSLLAFSLVLSVFKPWGRIRKRRA